MLSNPEIACIFLLVIAAILTILGAARSIFGQPEEEPQTFTFAYFERPFADQKLFTVKAVNQFEANTIAKELYAKMRKKGIIERLQFYPIYK